MEKKNEKKKMISKILNKRAEAYVETMVQMLAIVVVGAMILWSAYSGMSVVMKSTGDRIENVLRVKDGGFVEVNPGNQTGDPGVENNPGTVIVDDELGVPELALKGKTLEWSEVAGAGEYIVRYSVKKGCPESGLILYTGYRNTLDLSQLVNMGVSKCYLSVQAVSAVNSNIRGKISNEVLMNTNNGFIIIGERGMAISDNGIEWTNLGLDEYRLIDICYADKYVAIGYEVIMTSYSGDHWEVINTPNINWISVCYGDKYIALGLSYDDSQATPSYVLSESVDGREWSEPVVVGNASARYNKILSLCNTYFLLSNNSLCYSINGLDWTTANLPNNAKINSTIFSCDNYFVIPLTINETSSRQYSMIYTSVNLIEWVPALNTLLDGGTIFNVFKYDDTNKFMAYGWVDTENGKKYYSTYSNDGCSWRKIKDFKIYNSVDNIYDMYQYSDKLVHAVCYDNKDNYILIASSKNGSAWHDVVVNLPAPPRSSIINSGETYVYIPEAGNNAEIVCIENGEIICVNIDNFNPRQVFSRIAYCD